VYNLGLDEFIEWYGQEPRSGFTKATVNAWRGALEARGLGSVSINVRITAVRKLAVDAADNGLLAPELPAGISRVKGAKSKGVRVGNWLSLRQALLNAPDTTTKKGLRDRAMLAILLGCGLRRSDVAVLILSHIQQRDNRWCIIDLIGKHGRVRTIPMPTMAGQCCFRWSAGGAGGNPQDDDGGTGSVYAGLAQLFRLLRNTRSVNLPYPLGPVATQGGFVATVQDTAPSPSRAIETGGSSAAGTQDRQ
jgi:site-specific recombinase XerC